MHVAIRPHIGHISTGDRQMGSLGTNVQRLYVVDLRLPAMLAYGESPECPESPFLYFGKLDEKIISYLYSSKSVAHWILLAMSFAGYASGQFAIASHF